ncbi:kinase-like protein [Trametes gibbosa]|nr:kinase-like protein [Trametes gibbosa]
MTSANEIFAIKRVSLDKVDADTMAGYMNEIGLLKRLEGNARIIRLYDSEVKQTTANTKGLLLLVMECGEIDLAKLLQEQQKELMDPVWIAYYWKQMLQAVHVIHEEKIVHSDLKPANFVLVRGQLKLIDFGIANAIANDTTNIQRDHQIGTVNYMSPEAIELPDGMRRLKVGRPSDVWSLGCILYQMVYGQPPFQALSVYQKMKAIPDTEYIIQFPEYAVPVTPPPKEDPSGEPAPIIDPEERKVRVPQSIINTMKSCLVRNPKERATIPELLQQNWLEPEMPSMPPMVTPSPPPRPPTPPTAESLLKPDETIINPHYMKQLLLYGIRLGAQSDLHELTDEKLHADAQVSSP